MQNIKKNIGTDSSAVRGRAPPETAMSSRIFTVVSTSSVDDNELPSPDPFRIILTSLNMVGVFPFGLPNAGSFWTRPAMVYRSAAVLYLHYVAVTHLYNICSGVRNWTEIITSFIAWSSVFTLDYMCLKRQSLESLLTSMRACLAESSRKANEAVVSRSRVCTVCIWTYLAAFIVNSICTVAVSCPQSSWNSYFFGTNASRVSERKARAAALVVTTLRLYLVDGPWFFTMALFVLSCWVLRTSFMDLEQKVHGIRFSYSP